MSEVCKRTYKTLLACLMLITLVSGCSGTGTGNPTITAGTGDTGQLVETVPPDDTTQTEDTKTAEASSNQFDEKTFDTATFE